MLINEDPFWIRLYLLAGWSSVIMASGLKGESLSLPQIFLIILSFSIDTVVLLDPRTCMSVTVSCFLRVPAHEQFFPFVVPRLVTFGPFWKLLSWFHNASPPSPKRIINVRDFLSHWKRLSEAIGTCTVSLPLIMSIIAACHCRRRISRFDSVILIGLNGSRWRDGNTRLPVKKLEFKPWVPWRTNTIHEL